MHKSKLLGLLQQYFYRSAAFQSINKSITQGDAPYVSLKNKSQAWTPFVTRS